MRSPPDSRAGILIFVPGRLGERMSGPEIRAWQIARALAGERRVTAAVPGAAEGVREGIRVVPATRPRLLREAARHDAVMAACLPPYLLMAARARGVIAVSDLYDPVELELGTLARGAAAFRQVETARRVRRLHLAYSDIALCAGEGQRRQLIGEAQALGRSDPAVAVVPFGLPDAPERSPDRPLRRHFPQIGEQDRVVLWWGSIWRWLDAETAIRAVASLAGSRPEVKLVLTTGRPPDGDTEKHLATEEARSLARSLGVLDRTVLFLDEWIPYEERHRYLQEADVGLTLHADTPEATLAARARYLDYLWASLPCVLARGDEIAAGFAGAGLARLVEPRDVEGSRRALLALLDEPDSLRRAREAAGPLADSYRWPAVVRPLSAALDRAARARARHPGGAAGLAAGAASYYARRAADRLAAA